MATYTISGIVKEDGVPEQHMLIALKADRSDPGTIGQELGRTTANSQGLFELSFNDWTGNVAVVALDLTTGTTKQAEVVDWITGVGAGTDPYFSYVKLLSHMEGSDGGSSFVDEIGNTMTAFNGAVTSITQAKYGSTSGKFVKLLKSRVRVDHNAAFNPGALDFTVECWAYFETLEGLQTIMAKRENNWLGKQYDKGVFVLKASGTYVQALVREGEKTWAGGAYGTLPLQQWTHIAMSKFADTCRVFIDGVEVGNFAVPYTLLDDDKPIQIGAEDDGEDPMGGYLDEIRYTVGISRYNDTFAPPGFAFPNS